MAISTKSNMRTTTVKKKSAACAQKKISFSLCFVAIVKYFFCWPLQL